MSEILLLAARIRTGPVLLMAYSADLSKAVVVGTDGLHQVVNTQEVSVDYHYDPEKGWRGDFEQPQQEEAGGGI
jgi:hypothetical protein